MRTTAVLRPAAKAAGCGLALAVLATAACTSRPTATQASPLRGSTAQASTAQVASTPHPVNPPVPVRTSRLAFPPPIHPTGTASIAGCPLFPVDNPWRREISFAPISPRSAAWVASIGASRFLHPDFGSNPSYGIPYSVVPASQPGVPIRFTAYGDESDPGPYPIPSDARIEAGGDAHVLVASGDCHLYELYGPPAAALVGPRSPARSST